MHFETREQTSTIPLHLPQIGNFNYTQPKNWTSLYPTLDSTVCTKRWQHHTNVQPGLAKATNHQTQ
jgi:hypothetical protein